MILVADIGGTHTRFAVAERGTDGWVFHDLVVEDTRHDLAGLVRDYVSRLSYASKIEAFACCGAGPRLADGSLRLTNAPVHLEPTSLATAAGVSEVFILNDFEAVAHALPALRDRDLRRCGGQDPDPQAARVALGPGTGLGVALLAPYEGHWVALPGEGGHADLAPVNEIEYGIARRLTEHLGRLDAEALLCGPGLERLYGALSGGEVLSAAALDEAARAGSPIALQVIEVFTRWLGRFAGNLALTVGARGGVFLAGGILPAWGPLFDAAVFRQGFEDKGGFTHLMQQIPAYVIVHPQPGLVGLASYVGESGRHSVAARVS